MLSKDITLINELGLHARPAAQIAKVAATAVSDVWILQDDEQVNAKNILDILSLYCPKGASIRFVVEDAKDSTVLDALATLVENGFGELS